MSYDLSFVAPHRRDEVLRRIGVLDEFAKRPGRAAARLSAGQLGLGLTQFYRLARVWAAHRRPELLAGSAAARPRTTRATARQLQVVELACIERPNANVASVAAHAITLAKAAGVEMPSTNSVRKIVEMKRVGRVAPNSPAAGADLVVATCAVDIAVTRTGEPPTMPVATIIIHTSPSARVLGLALSLDASAPTAARAIADTLLAWTSTFQSATPSIAVEPGPGPAWVDLVRALSATGGDVRAMEPRPHSVMNDAVALLGRKPAGLRLAPDLTSKPIDARQPRLAAGAVPLMMADAERLLRQRLVSPSTPAPMPWFTQSAADELMRRIYPIIAE